MSELLSNVVGCMEAILRAKKLYGESKRKTTNVELHKAGEKAFKELEKELK